MILIFPINIYWLNWLGSMMKFWLDSALIAMAIISHFIGDHVVDLTFRRPFEITSLRHLFIQVLIMSISEPKISVPDKMTWPMELKPHLIFVRRLLSSTYRLPPRLIHTYVSRCSCTSVLLLADHHRVFQVIWNRSSAAKILLFSYFM